MIATLSSSLMAASREREWRGLVSRTRSPLPKSGVDRRRWQGATTRNSWRYSEEEQRSQRRRDAPEFGDGLRIRDTRTARLDVGRFWPNSCFVAYFSGGDPRLLKILAGAGLAYGLLQAW